jgi:putative flippase GtrA
MAGGNRTAEAKAVWFHFVRKEWSLIMKNLFAQIMKFGVVGAVCFGIDYIIGYSVMKIIVKLGGGTLFELASMAGSALGFTVSVIINYILSFKFVFERKEDLDRRKEFVAFIILSVIGLGLNQLIIWICVGPVYGNIAFLRNILNYDLAYTGAKVIATAIVMVYNFVTRKIFLEKKA